MKFILFVILFLANDLFAQSVVARIIDGDTFETNSGVKVRIIGIDAPENDDASTNHLRDLIEGRQVNLVQEGDRTDKYGRTLAIPELIDGTDIARKMIHDGFAFTYLKYPCSRTDTYLAEEVEARKSGRGMWSGHFLSTIGGSSQSGLQSSQSAQAPLAKEAEFKPTNSLPTAASEKSQITVYTTKTGSKYHKAGCKYLSKSKFPTSLEDAKAGGYDPCSVCRPPT